MSKLSVKQNHMETLDKDRVGFKKLIVAERPDKDFTIEWLVSEVEEFKPDLIAINAYQQSVLSSSTGDWTTFRGIPIVVKKDLESDN